MPAVFDKLPDSMRLLFNIFSVLVFSLPIFQLFAKAQEKPNEPILRWQNLRDFGVEGKGWTDTKNFYDRLPARAEKIVREPVWRLSQNSAGMSVRFVTDSDAIYARWTLRSPSLQMSHMPATGVSGLDLYVKENGRWRWLAVGIPDKFPTSEKKLITNIALQKREYQLYLPLYNGIESIEIGVPEKFTVEKSATDNSKPIVFYGTSIVQGAVASHTGMAYPSILGRRLNVPTINLGFSGNGRMEAEVAELLTEIDAAVFVVDCLPNLSTGAEVEERTPKVVEILRRKHPNTPIILVENLIYPDSILEQTKRKKYLEKNETLRRVYQNLLKSGVKRLYYVRADNLIGTDGDATVDGVHPTDLGFVRIADVLEPVLQRALKNR